MKDIRLNKVPYGGYVIWEWIYPDYVLCDVEKPGYDYAVASLGDIDEAKMWIDAHPNGDVVVDAIEAEKAERVRTAIIDMLCG